MPEPEPIILAQNDDGVVTVTLNRPEAMNALSAELRWNIVRTFRELQADDSAEVVILTGAGRAFCAGLDLKELGGEVPAADVPTLSNDDFANALSGFDRPIIGAINGVAITGGFELALMCDILIGSTNARFADTHSRVGVIPGWGLSQRLPRLIGISRAKELSLTGNFLNAETAERWGLINYALPPDELLPFCRKLAKDIQSCVPELVRGYKRIIDEGFGMPFAEALAHESAVSQEWSAAEVTPERVASRRLGILARGRASTR